MLSTGNAKARAIKWASFFFTLSRKSQYVLNAHAQEIKYAANICAGVHATTIYILYTLGSASLLVKLKPRIFQRLPPFE